MSDFIDSELDPIPLERVVEALELHLAQAADLGPDDLMAFQAEGIPLSPQWHAKYETWCQRHHELVQTIEQLAPDLPSRESSPRAWCDQLRQQAQARREAQQREAQIAQEITDRLARIRELQVAPDGAPESVLTAPRQVAEGFQSATLTFSGRRETRDDPRYHALQSILLLLTPNPGSPLPYEVRRAALTLVRSQFGEELAEAILLGGVRLAGHDRPPVPPTPPETPPTPRSTSPLGPPLDVIDPAAAIEKLTLGKAQPAPPPHHAQAAGVPNQHVSLEELLAVYRKLQAETTKLKGWGDNREKTSIYEAILEAIDYLGAIKSDPRWDNDREHSVVEFRQVLQYLASFQSALRVLCEPAVDEHQAGVFRCLKKITDEHRFFVSHHMKLTDRGAPSECPVWWEQMRTARACWDRPALRKRLVATLAEEVKQDPLDWPKVFQCVDDIVHLAKTPHSSVDLRSSLMPILDRLPAELDPPESFLRVMDSIDEYLTNREKSKAEVPATRETEREVAELRNLIAGKVVVLLGGVIDPHARDRLKEAFGLSELLWIPAIRGASLETLSHQIRQPNVLLVLLAIRWMSHNHSYIEDHCNPGTLVVRLKAGIHPNRVAHDALNQCGDRLRVEITSRAS